MKLYKRKKMSEIKRQLYMANKYLTSLDEKMSKIEKDRREVLGRIQALKNEMDDALELENEEKEVFVSNKVPVVDALAEQTGHPLKAVQTAGRTISFVYNMDGKEVFYSYDDIDEGVKTEIARLRKLLREVGETETVVV
jgi:vacuolar-type H+-ATPase subunit D/Vma8